MKRSSLQAFTLIEMLTVMAIIAVLTGLIVSVAGYAQNRAARDRTRGEIVEMSQGLEGYKLDFGSYPQEKKTDELDPKIHGNPATGREGELYQDSSRILYSALSGDYEPKDKPDGKPESKGYIEFRPDRLKFKADAVGKIQEVKYIQDTFGNSYGYSTAGLKEEQNYRNSVKKNPNATRKTNPPGYSPTFDLWSTGGQTSIHNSGKWITSWGN